MKIEILGPGCFKCKATEAVVRTAVKKLGIKADIRHMYDVSKIAEYGVMLTPAVVVDGKVVIEGKVPTESDIEKLLKKL
jgi:small redox-active disulfide protein 2